MSKSKKITYAPPLKHGEAIRIIAPSSVVDAKKLYAGAEILSKLGFKVLLDEKRLFRSYKYLAGTDAEREAELLEALYEQESRAIICARGGYGLTRILGNIGKRDVLKKPKWIIGFSDVTAWLAWSYKNGLAAIHGPLASTLADSSEKELEHLQALLTKPHDHFKGRPLPFFKLRPLSRTRKSVIKGNLFFGNLTMLANLCGTRFFPDFSGVVLGLEDVGEAPYRIDRLLTQLKNNRVFDKIEALILGHFNDCLPPAGGDYSVWELFSDFRGELKVPVFRADFFGHASPNVPVIVGAPVTIKSNRLYYE
jgi:muramoyltetrapeptide carboxypeptidase